jgi:hypothetical protein
MSGKYFYKEQDITIDVLFKIEHIVSILAEKEKRAFDEMFALFLASKTYATLQRTQNLLWAESAEFIVDEYYREKEAEVFV